MGSWPRCSSRLMLTIFERLLLLSILCKVPFFHGLFNLRQTHLQIWYRGRFRDHSNRGVVVAGGTSGLGFYSASLKQMESLNSSSLGKLFWTSALASVLVELLIFFFWNWNVLASDIINNRQKVRGEEVLLRWQEPFSELVHTCLGFAPADKFVHPSRLIIFLHSAAFFISSQQVGCISAKAVCLRFHHPDDGKTLRVWIDVLHVPSSSSCC